MLVIVGSVNADLFFNPDHLPGPGATVLCPDYTVHTGGKGANQAVAAARAGAPVAMVGAVGDDVFAATARQTLAAAGVDVGGLITSPGATGAAVVAVDGRGENQIIVASGANGRVSLAQVEALDFGVVTTLLLQMEIPRAVVEAAIDRAAAAGVRVVLNLAPAAPLDPARLSRVDVLIANRGEADSLVPEADDALQQARLLAARHGLLAVVTLGADGAVAADDAGHAWRVVALPVTVIDTVGAGDAFVGALAAALDCGRPMARALAEASVAGAHACTQRGPQTSPTADRIAAALANLDGGDLVQLV
ncbi:MAG: PfkB family carbohydrate kinase [Pseudomonadota bacterium]|nr:PfkB family carbohydrate kinase [Pseudomonadota bacterium]